MAAFFVALAAISEYDGVKSWFNAAPFLIG
jgi:hypothetical protein